MNMNSHNSHNTFNQNFASNHFKFNGKKPNQTNFFKNDNYTIFFKNNDSNKLNIKNNMIGKKRKNNFPTNSENVQNEKRKKIHHHENKKGGNDFDSNLSIFYNYLKYESMNIIYNKSKYSNNKFIPSFSFENFSK